MRALRKVNRRRNNGFLFPAPLAMLLAALAIFFLSYLWLSSRCEALARETKRLELRREDVRRLVQNEQFKWAKATSLSRIEARMRALGLDMSFPPPHRVVHIDRPMQVADLNLDAVWGGALVRTTDRESQRQHD